MIKVYVNWLPKNVNGGSFFPFIFVNSRLKGTEKETTVVHHEAIHIAQSTELLVVFFYLFYAINFVWNLFKYKFDTYKAYREVVFEKEAFDNQDECCYVKFRKLYAWAK